MKQKFHLTNRLAGLAVMAILLSVVTVMTTLNNHASAADLSKFSAGRIIDDHVFFDPSGLTVNEVQAFLNAKVPACDTNGTQPYGGTTRSDYGSSRGYPPPYVCMKDYIEQTTFKPADAYCNGYPAVRKTAAEIIHGVSQSCGINPRVLIVLLQKEQGLVTDDWPWSLQYRGATGYGCPDTADCDTEYYGFFNQVYHAARQFKMYAANNSSYVYRAYRNNYIQWNPNSSCGGSTVYIENLATSGLYNYTPYRPNQAALNAGYGIGDGCSAYGNRNFWLYYNDWFGSTLTPNYYWLPFSQRAYTDSSMSTPIDITDRVQGDRVYLVMKVKNSGVATWQRGTVNLATSNPANRASSLYDPSWPSNNRPAYFQETSVAPNEIATYGLWINLPKTGTYKEYFTLVADNITWMNDMGAYFEFNVQPARYTWEYVDQKSYTDQTKSNPVDTSFFTTPGTRYYNVIRVKNSGNIAWKKNFVNLGTANPTDRRSQSYDSAWLSYNRPATLTQDTVHPGEIGTFEFWTRTPTTVGDNKEYFNLLAENLTWMNDMGMYFSYNVNKPYHWSMVSQRAFTDQSKSNTANTSALSPNSRAYLQIKVRNTGTATWKKNFVNLGTANPTDRQSLFKDPTWSSSNRPTTLLEDTVAPGEIGTFEFWITTPSISGTYAEYLNLVAENITWFTDYGMYYALKVQ